MSKITLLESEIYNRIAAGEVVENPKSIVKELIENCIDAGATAIEVEICNGGISYIRVTDNGVGMEKEDLEKSILPHATSKINSLSDLDCISTLGFRGEALASIASVCNIKITSRKEDCQLGNYIEYGFGKKLDGGCCGCAEGTSVMVRDLFEKIPARKKFLRKPGTEAAEVSNYIVRAILSNYNISIKYTSDNVIIYHSDGKGLQSAIYTVYGKEFMDKLVFFEQTMSDITIYGFVGRPGFSKHNRSFQTLIVNGRYVVNNDITFVMQSCYRDFLMTRQFPVWILFLDLPNNQVDVNVHPHKMDVKFVDFGKIKKTIHSAVKGTIVPDISSSMSFNEIISDQSVTNTVGDAKNLHLYGTSNHKTDDFTTDKEFIFDNNIDSDKSALLSKLSISKDSIRKNSIMKESTAFSQFIENKEFLKNSDKINQQNNESLNKIDSAFTKTNGIIEKHNSENNIDKKSESHLFAGNEEKASKQSSFNIAKNFETKVLCKLFNTYILLEHFDDLFLIDQHAAHERIIFDRLLSQFNNDFTLMQPLLLPYVFDLSHNEGNILVDNIELLSSMGFAISKLSRNSFSLNSVPLICSNIDCSEFIRYFFENLNRNKLNESDILREKIAKAACASAVKGHDDLSLDEINKLLFDMQNTSGLFCPHGRPIVIKLTKREIEKWFKRIV